MIPTANQLLPPNHPKVLRRTARRANIVVISQAVIARFAPGTCGRITGVRLHRGILEGRPLHGAEAGTWTPILLAADGPSLVDERGHQVIGSRHPRYT